MPITLQSFRKSYPAYDDVSDEELVQSLHKKFYSDMDFNSFSEKIGFTPTEPDALEEKIAPLPKESFATEALDIGSKEGQPLPGQLKQRIPEELRQPPVFDQAAPGVEPPRDNNVPQELRPVPTFDQATPELKQEVTNRDASLIRDVAIPTAVQAGKEVIGGVETGLNFVSSFINFLGGNAIAGTAGIVSGATGIGKGEDAVEKATNTIHYFQEALEPLLVYKPVTESGKRGAKGIEMVFSKLKEWANIAGDKTFDVVEPIAGQEIAKQAATTVNTLVELGPIFLGEAFKGARKKVAKGEPLTPEEAQAFEEGISEIGEKLSQEDKGASFNETQQQLNEVVNTVKASGTKASIGEIIGKESKDAVVEKVKTEASEKLLLELDEIRGLLPEYRKQLQEPLTLKEGIEPEVKAKREPIESRIRAKNERVFNEMSDELTFAEAGRKIYEDGKFVGALKSSFPQWYKDATSLFDLNGKKEALNILEKAKNGEKLSERQLSVFDKFLEGKRDEIFDRVYRYRKNNLKEKKQNHAEFKQFVKDTDKPKEGIKGSQSEIDVPEQVHQTTKAQDLKKILDAQAKQKLKAPVKQKESGPLFEKEEKGGDLFKDAGEKEKAATPSGNADTGGYADTKPSIMEMPEIVSLAKDLMGGKLPKIKERIGRSRSALGMFKGGRGIDLRANVFKDEATAAKVLSHEIGHLSDWLPDKTLKRGNILGHVAALKKYMKSLLEEYPGSPNKILTPKDRARLRREAGKLAAKEQFAKTGTEKVSPEEVLAIWKDNAAREKDPGMYDYVARLSKEEKKDLMKSAMKKIIPDWFGFKKGGYTTAPAGIKELYQQLLKEEILKRRLFEKDVINKELKDLTQTWKPFDVNQDASFTKYRHSPSELYADAVSVLLNDPALLKQTAPSFNKAFFAYLERRQPVRDAYKAIQDLIGSGRVLEKRDVDIDSMFERGETALQEAAKEEPLDLIKAINKEMVDKWSPLIKRKRALKKAGVDIPIERDPEYWVEELPYISSEIFQHLRDVDNNVMKPMKGKDITIDDLGKYQFLKRVETERADKANPLGQTPTTAVKQLEFLKKKWGQNKFELVEGFVNEFVRLRKENVISVLKKADMLDPELMKIIENNAVYVTFDVQKFLEKRYGRNISSLIHKQIGTLQDITNPFVATLMKDAALIRAANVKMIKENTVEFYKDDIKPADTRWNGRYHEPIDPKDPKQGMIAYLDKGEVKAYYLPKEIAEAFNKDAYEAGKLVKGLEMISAPLKEIFVGKNPFWMMWNIQRDIKAFAKQLPGASIPKAVKYIIKSFPDAYQDVFKGKSSKDVVELYKDKMISIDRHFRPIESSPEHMIDRMLMNYGLSKPEYQSKVVKPIVWFWRQLDKPGKFSERVTKIAGLKYLKDKNIQGKELGHLVRSRAGSPDFLRGGMHRRAYNTLFFFSNAGIQGIRAAKEAAIENPTSYAWKTFKYDVAPKLFMYGAAIGLFGPAVKAMMDRIPDRDKENYITIPLGMTETGKTVYFVQPHDFQGQMLSGVLWDILNAKKPEDTKALLDFMGGGMPYSSLNPYIGWAIDAWQFATGKNPYNEWSGREVIPPQIFEAGDDRAKREFLKHTWNSMGGSVVYRFKHDDVESIKTDLEKIFDVPLAGSFIRRFIRVDDWGLRSQLRKAKNEVSRQNARELLDAKETLTKMVNQEKVTTADIEALAQKSTIIKSNLMRMLTKKYGNAYLKEFMSAKSAKEKVVVLQRFLEDTRQ